MTLPYGYTDASYIFFMQFTIFDDFIGTFSVGRSDRKLKEPRAESRAVEFDELWFSVCRQSDVLCEQSMVDDMLSHLPGEVEHAVEIRNPVGFVFEITSVERRITVAVLIGRKLSQRSVQLHPDEDPSCMCIIHIGTFSADSHDDRKNFYFIRFYRSV